MSFKLHYFRELSNPGTRDLRAVEIDSKFEFNKNETCPACARKLEVLLILVGEDGTKVKIGACDSCGYIGYMDRPTQKWLSNFYLEEWAVDRKEDFKSAELQPRKEKVIEKAAGMLEGKNATIFEVGSGKGEILREFNKLGFNKISGIENSRRLSEKVEKNIGVKVIVGSMESDEHINAIGKKNLVISWHVIEHAFDTNKFLANISKLQDDGDILVLALPNAEAEPMVNTLFWLPHLHAFTKISLEKLLNKNGYELLFDDSKVSDEIIFFAKRSISPKTRLNSSGNYLEKYRKRFDDYFYMSALKDGAKYCFTWSPKTFHTSFQITSDSEMIDRTRLFFERLYYFFSARLWGKFSNHRSFVYSKIASERVPLEVRYNGKIKLLVR